MKKIVLLIAAVFVLGAAPSYAVGLTVGVNTWYSYWKFEDSFEKIDPGFLYGPAFAFTFLQDFNLNFVFLYGTYDVNNGFDNYTYKRYDSDTSIAYRIGSYFKIFAGVKYNGYTTEIAAYNMEMKAHMYGPAAGISAVMPLGYDFYILANGSGLYLKTISKTTGMTDQKNEGYGYNTSASLAYYISPASVTLSLGGRYQYIQIVYDDPYSEDTKMKFYGVTASATYSF